MGMKKDGKYSCLLLFHSMFNVFLLAVQKERDRLGRQRCSNPNYGASSNQSSPNKPIYRNDNGENHDSNVVGDDKNNNKNNVDDDDGHGDDPSVTALLRAEKTAQEVCRQRSYAFRFQQ
jgi:hypothetical protein